jgi:hypothetical protein
MHLPYVPGLSLLVGESSVGQTGSCGVGFSSFAAKILPEVLSGCARVANSAMKCVWEAVIFLLVARMRSCAALCIPSGSSQKIPGCHEDRTASRNDPLDPLFPNNPD